VEDLPDPLDEQQFVESKLRWSGAATPAGKRQLAFTRHLAELRQRHIVPLLAGTAPLQYRAFPTEEGVIAVDWRFGEALLELRVNLSEGTRSIPAVRGEPIFTSEAPDSRTATEGELSGPGIVVAVAR
jgi:1,4-alpha-glucan branching enzyme